MNINVKKPCANCPFKREGAIELREGRLAQIARELMANDQTPFLCHKTVYRSGSKACHDRGESVCAGSMIFLLKAGAPNVAMRMAAALGLIDFKDLRAQYDDILEPHEVLPELARDDADSANR